MKRCKPSKTNYKCSTCKKDCKYFKTIKQQEDDAFNEVGRNLILRGFGFKKSKKPKSKIEWR